jgi:PAS domain S-box-containing protein
VDSSDDAIISKTLDGIVTSWNRSAEKMFGYSAAEAIGKSIRLIIPSERQAEEDFVLDRIHRGEKVDHFETVRQTKDGRRLDISLTVSPVRNAEGLVIGASKIARDITQQKQLERERESALQKLAEALAARDDFIAVAAHELRNPLNVLELMWALLERTPAFSGASAQARNLFEKSRAQLSRLASLVDRLLDVTRVRAGIFDLYREFFDLSDLVREIIGRLTIENPALPISLEIEPHIEGSWDRLRIDQVLTNLVSNAVKYGLNHPINVTVSVDSDHVAIEVRDEGIGISPEQLDRIFDRFERGTGSKNAGLGIGLWITKQIVEAHGGTIHAESVVGKGSAFVVRLPRTSPQDASD